MVPNLVWVLIKTQNPDGQQQIIIGSQIKFWMPDSELKTRNSETETF